MSFGTTESSQRESQKLLQRLKDQFSVFYLFLTELIMAILSKGCKLQNSLQLSFTNFRELRANFVECASLHESNSPEILLYVRQTRITQLFLEISL